MYEKAYRIAKQAHQNQKDKGGRDYFLHPLAVASRFQDEVYKTVAILHDVVEDTSWTLEDLRQAGMPEVVIEAVDAMTHRPAESYQEYIYRLKDNEIARAVKLADIENNLSPERAYGSKEERAKLRTKYRKAYEYIQKVQEKKQAEQ